MLVRINSFCTVIFWKVSNSTVYISAANAFCAVCGSVFMCEHKLPILFYYGSAEVCVGASVGIWWL